MITGVVAAGVTDIHAHKGLRDRFIYIGSKPHTLMFKAEVCKMDHNGKVYETVKCPYASATPPWLVARFVVDYSLETCRVPELGIN